MTMKEGMCWRPPDDITLRSAVVKPLDQLDATYSASSPLVRLGTVVMSAE
jgi:hypothetical protein